MDNEELLMMSFLMTQLNEQKKQLRELNAQKRRKNEYVTTIDGVPVTREQLDAYLDQLVAEADRIEKEIEYYKKHGFDN